MNWQKNRDVSGRERKDVGEAGAGSREEEGGQGKEAGGENETD